MNFRRISLYTGIGLLLVGGIILVRIPYFYYHSNHVGNQLLKDASQMDASKTNATKNETSKTGTPIPAGLLGTVYIPTLDVKAPLLEGTADKQLAVGVGHLKTSVMPGQPGTSLIAAHNATWFRNIGKLKTGDEIYIQTKSGRATFAVTGHKVVHTGHPVLDTSLPTIVLETCYPTDALYLTPYRLLVFGKWVNNGSKGAPEIESPVNIHYQAKIPSRIRHEGITLQTNNLPMGTLHIHGDADQTYLQSNAPLSASGVAVELFLAWLHASADKDGSALHDLTPGLQTNPLYGVNLRHIRYSQNFTITLTVHHKTLTQIEARTTVKAGQSYPIEVDYGVTGNVISIRDVKFLN